MRIKIILEDCSLEEVQNLFNQNTTPFCGEDVQTQVRDISTKSDDVPKTKYELTPSIKAGERAIVNDEGEVVNPLTDEKTELVEKVDSRRPTSNKAIKAQEEVEPENVEEKPKKSTRSRRSAVSLDDTEETNDTVEETTEAVDEYEHFDDTKQEEETVVEETVVEEVTESVEEVTETVEETTDTVDEETEETKVSSHDVAEEDDYEKYVEDFDDDNL